MKNIHIVSKYKMRWIEPISKYLSRYAKVSVSSSASPPNLIETPDLVLFMWADDIVLDYINNEPKISKYIVFTRAYEYVEEWFPLINWGKVDRVICVNDYIAKAIEKIVKTKPPVIYNSVKKDYWKFANRRHGKNVAMVGFIHYKKNHAMALQILSMLPEDYTLHLAGDTQHFDVINYLDNLAIQLNRKIYIYGQIKESNLDLWLEDKNYILSTSMREGCPNNVIEAMAKGIKPVVHNWPGAKEQFGECVFNTIDEAVAMISSDSPYNSDQYLKCVNDKFSEDNFNKLAEIILNEV